VATNAWRAAWREMHRQSCISGERLSDQRTDPTPLTTLFATTVHRARWSPLRDLRPCASTIGASPCSSSKIMHKNMQLCISFYIRCWCLHSLLLVFGTSAMLHCSPKEHFYTACISLQKPAAKHDAQVEYQGENKWLQDADRCRKIVTCASAGGALPWPANDRTGAGAGVAEQGQVRQQRRRLGYNMALARSAAATGKLLSQRRCQRARAAAP